MLTWVVPTTATAAVLAWKHIVFVALDTLAKTARLAAQASAPAMVSALMARANASLDGAVVIAASPISALAMTLCKDLARAEVFASVPRVNVSVNPALRDLIAPRRVSVASVAATADFAKTTVVIATPITRVSIAR